MAASYLGLHSRLPEMGISLQFEGYMMGYSSAKNMNENSSSSWCPYLYNNLMNEQVYNNFRMVNDYSGYTEVLKRTVVEHDALFREQVCELHRLYRTQKDLMNNIKRQELYNLSYQNRISQSQLLKSPVVSRINENLWLHTQNIKPCIDFLEQGCYIPRKEYPIRNDNDMVNLTLKPHHRQMVDLQLPADMYIGAEDHTDAIRKEDKANLICGVEYKSSDTKNEVDVQLTLGTREYKMNEEIYPNFKGTVSKQCSSFNYGDAGKSENRYNSFTLSNDSCQDQIVQLESKKNNSHNISFYDSKEIPALDCEHNQHNPPSLFDLNNPTLTQSHSHTPLSFSPCSEIASSSSQIVPSPKRKLPKTITLVPIAVQALPCFPTLEKIQRKKPKKDFQNYPKGIVIDLNEDISSEGDAPDLDTQIYSYDTLNILAAENLLAFSQGTSPNMDLLHWFADTILDKNSDIVIYKEVEVDFFETLTLNLEEMTPDEYLTSEQKLEIKEEKTRRGRKRREKKKDFRKEILPSLMTLSKHELNEDLHAFDCIMKAMGENWESKLTRKKLAKRKAGKLKFVATDLKVDICKMKMLIWGRKSKRGLRLRARQFSNFYS